MSNFYRQFLISWDLYFQDGLMSVTDVTTGVQCFIVHIYSSSLNDVVISGKF